ncbi:hypothetical protein AC70_4831 [Escherichia coli 2-210-07_S4_C1]|nr:hypothetical protein AC70_5024 [Escherichia coli 2-210-07_S4_C1]KDW82374.1 hypothetical protein AC70_5018 [Escherichia coli 2-210-07_S4_C1]KDW83544.1 hypothetical protein AC70_4893 [Escherichia coli 2-210-07_S4_C1]KDW84207.1 hypothetical protein AC70_4831 [Escherichia coli 2-210-07_S4_C1]
MELMTDRPSFEPEFSTRGPQVLSAVMFTGYSFVAQLCGD